MKLFVVLYVLISLGECVPMSWDDDESDSLFQNLFRSLGSYRQEDPQETGYYDEDPEETGYYEEIRPVTMPPACERTPRPGIVTSTTPKPPPTRPPPDCETTTRPPRRSTPKPPRTTMPPDCEPKITPDISKPSTTPKPPPTRPPPDCETTTRRPRTSTPKPPRTTMPPDCEPKITPDTSKVSTTPKPPPTRPPPDCETTTRPPTPSTPKPTRPPPDCETTPKIVDPPTPTPKPTRPPPECETTTRPPRRSTPKPTRPPPECEEPDAECDCKRKKREISFRDLEFGVHSFAGKANIKHFMDIVQRVSDGNLVISIFRNEFDATLAPFRNKEGWLDEAYGNFFRIVVKVSGHGIFDYSYNEEWAFNDGRRSNSIKSGYPLHTRAAEAVLRLKGEKHFDVNLTLGQDELLRRLDVSQYLGNVEDYEKYMGILSRPKVTVGGSDYPFTYEVLLFFVPKDTDIKEALIFFSKLAELSQEDVTTFLFKEHSISLHDENFYELMKPWIRVNENPNNVAIDIHGAMRKAISHPLKFMTLLSHHYPSEYGLAPIFTRSKRSKDKKEKMRKIFDETLEELKKTAAELNSKGRDQYDKIGESTNDKIKELFKKHRKAVGNKKEFKESHRFFEVIDK